MTRIETTAIQHNGTTRITILPFFALYLLLTITTTTNVLASDPIPGNDVCWGAVELNIGGVSESGSTVGANIESTTLPECNNVPTTTPDVWYTISGNGNRLSVNTCSSNVLFNPQIKVYKGTACLFLHTMECVASATTTTGSSSNCGTDTNGSIVEFDSEENQTYYIIVQGENGGIRDSFDIVVTNSIIASVQRSGNDKDDAKGQKEQEPQQQNSEEPALNERTNEIVYEQVQPAETIQWVTTNNGNNNAASDEATRNGGQEGESKNSNTAEQLQQQDTQATEPAAGMQWSTTTSNIAAEANKLELPAPQPQEQQEQQSEVVEPAAGIQWSTTTNNENTNTNQNTNDASNTDGEPTRNASEETKDAQQQQQQPQQPEVNIQWSTTTNNSINNANTEQNYEYKPMDYSPEGQNEEENIGKVEPPSNDHCDGARPISIGEEISAPTMGAAINDEVAYCRTQFDSEIKWLSGYASVKSVAIWFKVTGNGDYLQASSCDFYSAHSVNKINMEVDVYEGGSSCDSDELKCVGQPDAFFSPCGDANKAITWKSELNVEYYIMIRGSVLTSDGDFTIQDNFRLRVIEARAPEDNNNALLGTQEEEDEDATRTNNLNIGSKAGVGPLVPEQESTAGSIETVIFQIDSNNKKDENSSDNSSNPTNTEDEDLIANGGNDDGGNGFSAALITAMALAGVVGIGIGFTLYKTFTTYKGLNELEAMKANKLKDLDNINDNTRRRSNDTSNNNSSSDLMETTDNSVPESASLPV